MQVSKRVLFMYITCGLAFCCFLILAALIPTSRSQAHVMERISANVCQQIIAAAYQRVHDYCDGLGRNSACYGNTSVNAKFTSDSALRFDSVGDRVPIRVLRSLNVSPLDIQSGLWGLSLLKLQANLPDTLPGQNVTFLVYGDTSVESAGENMQAFYFTSGLGNPDCMEAPRDGIVVRSPNHMEVTFTVNGVDITIGSTLVMRAEANKVMELALIEGHGMIKTPFGSQAIHPGEQITIQLGGKNGLEPISAPSKPTVFTSDAGLDQMVCLLDHLDGKLCEGERMPVRMEKNPPTEAPAIPDMPDQSSVNNYSQPPVFNNPTVIIGTPTVTPIALKPTKTRKIKPTYPPKATYAVKPTKTP